MIARTFLGLGSGLYSQQTLAAEALAEAPVLGEDATQALGAAFKATGSPLGHAFQGLFDQYSWFRKKGNLEKARTAQESAARWVEKMDPKDWEKIIQEILSSPWATTEMPRLTPRRPIEIQFELAWQTYCDVDVRGAVLLDLLLEESLLSRMGQNPNIGYVTAPETEKDWVIDHLERKGFTRREEEGGIADTYDLMILNRPPDSSTPESVAQNLGEGSRLIVQTEKPDRWVVPWQNGTFHMKNLWEKEGLHGANPLFPGPNPDKGPLHAALLKK